MKLHDSEVTAAIKDGMKQVQLEFVQEYQEIQYRLSEAWEALYHRVMTNSDCIFCKIIAKEIPAEIIHETKDTIAIVDLQPNNIGHSLVIPKAHYENIYSLPNDLISTLFQEVRDVSLAVKNATHADGMNIHINNEQAAGQVIFHSHIHIIPRFYNDGLKHFDLKQYEYPDQIHDVGRKIRDAISLTK